MAFILNRTSNRFTTANLYGEPSGSGSVTAVSGGSGITASPSPITGAGSLDLGPMTADWAAGNFRITSANSFDVYRVDSPGDAILRTNFVTVAGDQTVTSAGASFVAGDVGKYIVIRGAGAAGGTHITTIDLVNSPTSVEVHVAPATSCPLPGVIGFYGTDGSAALTAAVGAAAGSTDVLGGTVVLPEGRMLLINYTLDLTLKYGVTIQGVGGETAGGALGSQLIFTTAAGPCIAIGGGTNGIVLRGFSILTENLAFAGDIVDCATTNAALVTFERMVFDSAGAGATTAINLTNPDTTLISIDRCCFYYGAVHVKGTGAAIQITRNQFGSSVFGPSVMAIEVSGQGWEITGNSFEGLISHDAFAIQCTGNCYGLDISGNWFGDNSTNTAAQAWMLLRGSGISVHGNFISSFTWQNVAGIRLTAACQGVSIKGNMVSAAGAPAGTIGIDGGGFAHENIDLTGNNLLSLVPITGFDSANYFSQGNTTNLRFGLGAASPDIYGYGVGDAVIESRGRTGKGVFQATGNTVDVDGTLEGQVDFAAMSITAGGADKRIAAIRADLHGTTATNRGGKLTLFTKKDAGATTAALVIDKDQKVGVGTTSPTRLLDLNGAQRQRGIAPPAVSEANSGVIYFDSALNRYRVSMNGGAFVDLVGSAGLTGTGVATKIGYWTNATNLDSAANIYVDSVNHRLGVGVAVPTYDVDVNGDVNVAATTGVLRKGGTTILDSKNTIPMPQAVTVGLGAGQQPYATNVGHDAATALMAAGVRTTAVGASALVATTAGADNTAVGANSGATNTVGLQNVFLGSGADASVNNLTNAVAIGYSASVGADNSMSLGNASMKVGIHTSTPAQPLDVNGAVATRHLDIVLAAGANEDIALTDSSWIRITGPAGGFSLGGFTNGTDGRHLTVLNTTANAMTIKNLSAGSAATNQILTLTGADVVLPARTSSATFIFEDTQDKWILTATS